MRQREIKSNRKRNIDGTGRDRTRQKDIERKRQRQIKSQI